MKRFEFQNIEVHKIEGLYCDYVILEAYWKDTGKELTSEELDALNEDYELVYELAIDFIQ